MPREDYVITRFQKEEINISKFQAEQFVKYFELLTEWNRKMNLTAITEFEEVVEKHFIDSCLLDKIFPDFPFQSVIDIGTGAGFPGIPLKILHPECRLVLLDSLQKRIYFLDEVISVLSLENVTAIHGRAEDLAGKEHREAYDCCVSRAVARLASLCELCIPYVRKGGYFIAYKARKSEEELNEAGKAISLLGAKAEQQFAYSLGDEYTRNLITIKKVKETDKRFPRRKGKPLKEPLI